MTKTAKNLTVYVLNNQAYMISNALHEASECGYLFRAYDVYKHSKAVIERTLEDLKEMKEFLDYEYEDVVTSYENLYDYLKELYKVNANDPRIIKEGVLFEYSDSEEDE